VTGAGGGTIEVPSANLTPEVLGAHDVTVIVTDHDAFDPHLIAEHAPTIVDTRNALSDVEDPDLREKISLLGGGE
jgi:UDP-N-acetyl-D-glucosamine dehydrogenase